MSSVGLSVSEQLDAALLFCEQENPGEYHSISKICRLADVNRSNVYTSHPEFVARLRENKARRHAKQLDSANRSKQSTVGILTACTRQNKALLFLVVELQEEIRRLTQRLTEADAIISQRYARARSSRG